MSNNLDLQTLLIPTDSQLDQFDIHELCGVIEAPVGRFVHGDTFDIMPIVSQSQGMIRGFMTSDADRPIGDIRDLTGMHNPMAEADDFLAAGDWGLHGEYDNGRIGLFKTDMPAATPGREVFAFVGKIAVKGVAADPVISHFSGPAYLDETVSFRRNLRDAKETMANIGIDITNPRVEKMNLRVQWIFNMPLWGFHDEPYSVGSLIDDDCKKTITQSQSLIFSGNKLDEFPADLAEKVSSYGLRTYLETMPIDTLSLIDQSYLDRMHRSAPLSEIKQRRQAFHEANGSRQLDYIGSEMRI